MTDPDYREEARRRAEQLAAVFANHQAIREAELAAQGIHPVSVVHGDAEDAESAELIYGTLQRLAEECGTLAAHVGGNAGNLGYRKVRNMQDIS